MVSYRVGSYSYLPCPVHEVTVTVNPRLSRDQSFTDLYEPIQKTTHIGRILQVADMIPDLIKDLQYALRTIRKNPIFVVFVVGTLALGIGANTTVFTIVNTLLLNALPVENVAGLAGIAAVESRNTATSNTPFPISYADLKDYESQNRVFNSLAGYTSPRMTTLQTNEKTELMFAELVTSNYFSTLGIKPAKGRFFSRDDSEGVVLNYGAWNSRFGGLEDIIGTNIKINGIMFTVIGVAPPGFIGVNAIFGPEVWIPASVTERLMPVEMKNALTDRAKATFLGIGRYNPGATRLVAQANLDTIAAALAKDHPDASQGHSIKVRPVRDVLLGSSSSGSSPVIFASVMLLVVVGIVLLIACSNVANLLLARSAFRRQEIAVRLAMGASRSRLIRQLMTESIVLGLLSGAGGLFIGYAGQRFLFSFLPNAATFVTPKFDANVFAYALVISLATAFLFGMMPALRASRAEVAETLKEEARTTGRSRKRITFANILVVGQVALSFVLLVTAALFLRSIGRAYQMDPGFQTKNLAVFMTNPGQAGYAKPQAKDFYRAVRERIGARPEVASVTWASNLPLWARPVNGVEMEGRQQRSRTDKVRAIVTTVDLNYFDTTRIALVSGREFSTADQENTTPVAIINEKLAHDYFPNGAVGRRIQLPGEKQWRQIVGIARTANYTSWGEAPQPCVYVPLEQSFADALTLFIRSNRDPHELLVPVQREIHTLAPSVLVSAVRTGAEIVDGGLFQARMAVGLLTVFGLLALGLASVGLYGLLAYSVNQRRREIGLRMALGAQPGNVLRLVLKEGMSLVGSGVLIGFLAALAVGRLLSGMLFGVDATDPFSVLLAGLTLSAAACLACYVPAHLATRVDPLAALHES